LATVPRERQASHRFLSDEMHGLRISALVMPTIFLIVAALVLNIVMSRLAERQRTIIGTLKATGYSNRQVIVHFLGFGVVVGLLGGLAGDAVGLLMASGLLHMYREFFQFPAFVFRVYPDLCLAGVGISVGFALAGAAKGVWAVLKLAPAEAMRPKPPERGGAIFLERFPALWQRLGFRTHMALRGLARNRTRTATGVVSSAIATSLILVTLVMTDSMFFLVDYEFAHVMHSDVDIGLRDERSVAALLEGRALPGVDEAEPVLALICDLRHGGRSRRLAITGLSADHRLTTPMQANLEPIAIPPEGLVCSRKLAEVLDARVGDRLVLTPVRGRRDPVTVHLASIVDSYLGLACYADLRYLGRIVGEATAVNAVQLAVNPARQGALFRTIKELPNAQGISVRSQTRANIESTFVKSLSFSLSLMVLFAGVIAFGSVLNSSLIEIGERIRDVATFRVLGYRPGQVASIFFRQNLVVFFLGLALAMPLGYGMVLLLAQAYDTELFRMPIVWRARTVVLTALLSFVFVLIAQWFVYRQVRKLDWLEGVKVRE
jgi:putative ABC transport system permease protein